MHGRAVTAAILAGGAGSRLGGRDKGLEQFAGRPLVARVLDALAGVDAVLIVANRNLDAYARYARTVQDAPDADAIDAGGVRHRGPLAGIAAALRACVTPWLLTVPVDCPDPPRELVRRLLDAATAHAARAVVAHDGERRQPLFAIYRSGLRDSATAAAVGGQGVWAWQDAIGAIELDFDDQRQQFSNLNTPEDFLAHAARLVDDR